MSALPRASSGAMGGAGIWIQMNVPFVESEFGNVIAPKSSAKLDDLVVFDSATDILMAEGWKRSGVFNCLANDEIILILLLWLVPISEATKIISFFFLQCACGMTYGNLTGNFMPIFELWKVFSCTEFISHYLIVSLTFLAYWMW